MTEEAKPDPEAEWTDAMPGPGGRSPEIRARNRRMVALKLSGVGTAEIAEMTGRAVNTVHTVLARVKVRDENYKDRVHVDGEAVARAYEELRTLNAVARRFGISKKVVETRVLRHGGKLRSAAKPVSIAAVVRLHRKGFSRAKIARILGREWRAINKTLKRAGVTPRPANRGGFAEKTITWRPSNGQNSVKTRTGWRALARVLWERAHGPVPAQCIISRIDGELPPNEIDLLPNLVRMTQRTRQARVWTARNVPIPDDPIDRRETLITILTVAALKVGDTTFKLGTW